MTTKQLKRTLGEAPFRPFLVYLVDGRSLAVRHPELLSFEGGGRIAVIELEPGLAESIDVLMIVSVRPVDAAPALPEQDN